VRSPCHLLCPEQRSNGPAKFGMAEWVCRMKLRCRNAAICRSSASKDTGTAALTHTTRNRLQESTENPGTLVWRPFAPVWSFSVGRRVAGSLLLGAFTGRALSTVLGAKDRVIVSATA